ncbi:MAG: IS6 family transposase [Thermoplasmatota archaeon]
MALSKDPSEMSAREKRALAIVQDASRQITKTSRSTWLVPSQTSPALGYVVTRINTGHPAQARWTCTCPDHETRLTTCKHQYAVQFLLAVQSAPKAAPAPEESAHSVVAPTSTVISRERPACKFCASASVVKIGVKSGSQQYRCKACKRKFVPASGFERVSADPQAVCLALDLSFKGMSLRKVTDTLNQFYALDVGKSTVHRWLEKYVALLNDYSETLAPHVGDKWHADEVFTKFSGKLQYVWHLMDAKTRYLLVSRVTEQRDKKDARAVFDAARDLAGKLPAEVVTDGLPAYQDAFHGAFNAGRSGERVKHTREIHISKPSRYPHNNKVERLNGTLRERQKVQRGLKKPTGPLTAGHAAYYNLIRPHQALDGNTPADVAGVGFHAIPGESRWAAAIFAAAGATRCEKPLRPTRVAANGTLDDDSADE